MEKSTHTPEYAALRSELRAARSNAGLTQRDIAARLKVPPSWIAKVESGERRIDLVEFCWLVRACGGDVAATCGEVAQRIAAAGSKRRRSGGRSQ